jgi:hypothetical protein
MAGYGFNDPEDTGDYQAHHVEFVPIGYIGYSSDNLALMEMMERIVEYLKAGGNPETICP